MEKYVVINSNSTFFLDKLMTAERTGHSIHGSASLRALSSMTAVPLDATSLMYAMQRNLPHIIPSDVVSSKIMAQLPQYVAGKIKDWAEAIDYRRLGFSCNWVLHDSVLLQSLLQSAYMAINMVAFFKENADKLVLPRRLNPEFLPNLCCSDAPQLIWEQYLPAISEILPYQHSNLRQPPPNAWGQDFSSLQDSIAFAYYETSIPRSFGHINQAIKKAKMQSTACLMPCMYHPSISCQIVSQDTITPYPPYLVAPLENPSSANPSYFSEDSLDEFVQSAQKHFPELGLLEPMIQQFVSERYTYLERMYRGLHALWSQYRPSVCAAEDLAQGEYCIPLLVADELGIPSVSTPHSLFDFPRITPAPASVYACASPLVKQAYQENDSECTAQAFDEVYCRSSYPSSTEYVLKKDKKFSILVLPTDLMQRYVPLFYSTSPKVVRKWLDALQAVPEKLKNSVELFYKLHPAFGAVELLKVLNISEKSIIPPEIPAEAIIESFDLVVCIEYVSSPNQIALEKNIPLINCIHDETTFNRAQQLFITNTFTVNDYDKLWPSVIHKILNPLEKQNFLAQQKESLDTMMRAPKDVWVPTLESLASPQKR